MITPKKCGFCGEWTFTPCQDPDDTDKCPRNPDPPEPDE